MKLVFRETARRDLRWFARYYSRTFPEGRKQAESRFRAAIELVLSNPGAGEVVAGFRVREFPVRGTPFLLIYSAKDGMIDILRVWDCRSDPGKLDEA
jgi:plasmid stabilization system protein ParE